MDIKFCFVYDTKNNSFILKKPDKKSQKYHAPILSSFKKKNYKKVDSETRVELDFGKSLKIYMIKKSRLMFGILGPKLKSKREIFKFLDEFYAKFKAMGKNLKIKSGDPIMIWLKQEIKAFKDGKKISNAQRVSGKISLASNGLENQLDKAMKMNTQLLQLDEEVAEMREVAIENKKVSNDVKNEAWWYNQKMTIMIFGVIGLFVLMIGLWIINLIL